MAAYVIVDVAIHDKVKYAEYVKQSPATVEAFGGRFVVRGGKAKVLEGDWTPGRFVMLEFDSVERAKKWWASEMSREPRKLRQSASSANMIVVEGCDGARTTASTCLRASASSPRGAFVDVTSVPNRNHQDDQLAFADLVDDSIR